MNIVAGRRLRGEWGVGRGRGGHTHTHTHAKSNNHLSVHMKMWGLEKRPVIMRCLLFWPSGLLCFSLSERAARGRRERHGKGFEEALIIRLIMAPCQAAIIR